MTQKRGGERDRIGEPTLAAIPLIARGGRVVLKGSQLGADPSLFKAMSDPARSLAAVAPRLPRAVISLVDKALAFSPADGWSSASAMQAVVIDAYVDLTGEPVPDRQRMSYAPWLEPGFGAQVTAATGAVDPGSVVIELSRRKD